MIKKIPHGCILSKNFILLNPYECYRKFLGLPYPTLLYFFCFNKLITNELRFSKHTLASVIYRVFQ